MYLFFDTETVGFPKKWNLPHTDTFNWPRMVQIGWTVYDKERVLIDKHEYIIKPEGFEIPYEAEKVHKITTEKAIEEGVDLKETLIKFAEAVKNAEYIIAHNMNFDSCVVGAEFIRKSVPNVLFSSELYCTMRESTHYCNIPGKYGKLKWPTLMELHIKLFKAKFANPHSALIDSAATAKCFFRLLDIEAMELF